MKFSDHSYNIIGYEADSSGYIVAVRVRVVIIEIVAVVWGGKPICKRDAISFCVDIDCWMVRAPVNSTCFIRLQMDLVEGGP